MANVGVVSGAFICISPSSSSEAWTLSNSRHLAADLQYSCSKVDSPPACSSTFLSIFLSPPPRFYSVYFAKWHLKISIILFPFPGATSSHRGWAASRPRAEGLRGGLWGRVGCSGLTYAETPRDLWNTTQCSVFTSRLISPEIEW